MFSNKKTEVQRCDLLKVTQLESNSHDFPSQEAKTEKSRAGGIIPPQSE